MSNHMRLAQQLTLPTALEGEVPLVHRWPVPANVRAERDAIVCSPLPERYEDLLSLNWVTNPPGRLLYEFCYLAEEGDDAMVAFAHKYGLLGLCKSHQIPAGHDDSCDEFAAYREPFARWRYIARSLDALLKIGLALHRDEPVEPEHWKIGGVSEQTLAEHGELGAFLRVFDTMMSRWGRTRPILVAPEGHFSLLFGGTSYSTALAAAIAYQAAMAMSGVHTLFCCAECNKLFPSTRARKPDQRAFCDTCRDNGAPGKFASRDYAARK